MKHYIKFTERNEWEGETWIFFIPYEGNEEALEQLSLLIKNNSNYDVHKQDLSIMWTEKGVNKMIKTTDIGYLPFYNKLKGRLNIKSLREDYKIDSDNALYKGRIREYMIKEKREK